MSRLSARKADPVFAAPVWPPPRAADLAAESDDPVLPTASVVFLERRGGQMPPAFPSVGLGVAPGPRPLPAEIRAPRLSLTLALSLAVHALAAIAFVAAVDTAARIAGADETAAVLLGNAPDDSAAQGDPLHDPSAVSATLVTLLDAKAVRTVEAVSVPADAAERVEPVPQEPLQPLAEMATLVPPADVAQRSGSETLQPSVPIATAQVAPEILTTERDDDVTVDPSAAEIVSAEPVPSATASAIEPEPVLAEEKTPTVEMGKVQPKPAAKKQAAAPAPEKSAKKIIEKPAKARPPIGSPATGNPGGGSSGTARTDARKGASNGSAQGKSASEGKGGKSGAGNAAVTNYPGKVVARLRRAARGISRAAIRQATNDVQVGFTVSASGGVGGVRITRSSGSAALDQAALAVVRRAAPFPPIPEAAGRSSWSFSVPLGLAR